jgi:hypothetical protein
MSSLFRAFSEQGPTFEGRAFGVEFHRGISGPIDGHQASVLASLGSFGVLDWDASAEVADWTQISTVPCRWTPTLSKPPAVNSSDASGGLPLFDPDKVELPDELPDCYKAIFDLYMKAKRGRR